MNKNQYVVITNWQDKTFTKATPLSCVNHLEEEVGELKKSIESGKVDKEEIADCFMLLMGVCNKSGFSYEDVVTLINEKYVVCITRKWGEVNDKGYVKHIKE